MEHLMSQKAEQEDLAEPSRADAAYRSLIQRWLEKYVARWGNEKRISHG